MKCSISLLIANLSEKNLTLLKVNFEISCILISIRKIFISRYMHALVDISKR